MAFEQIHAYNNAIIERLKEYKALRNSEYFVPYKECNIAGGAKKKAALEQHETLEAFWCRTTYHSENKTNKPINQ